MVCAAVLFRRVSVFTLAACSLSSTILCKLHLALQTDRTEMELIESRRGGSLAVLNGFVYRVDKKNAMVRRHINVISSRVRSKEFSLLTLQPLTKKNMIIHRTILP